MKLRYVRVLAMVGKDTFFIVDHELNQVSKRFSKSLMINVKTDLAREGTCRFKWQRWAQTLASEMTTPTYWTLMMPDPWEVKIKTWYVSLRCRGLDRQRPRTARAWFEGYGSQTWTDAFDRLWHQINNRYRYRTRDGWHRWCASVANNSNKRKGARYGPVSKRDEAGSDQGIAAESNGREAELPLRPDGRVAEPGDSST